ncbi:MAG TPA: hypothetical protein PKD51_17955 [Saprospiraceae bacterium]|nr:hypothetical protein [Saprospiraceae bacterium]
MKHLIVLLFVTISLSTFGQSAYEKGMQSALGLWSQGKNSEAVAMFERIAAAEKDNWLPNYYVALVSTTTAFATKDKTQVDALLKKAQSALDVEIKKLPNHPELLVMQAMIHTAWIAFDPMTNGMKLSGTVMEIYGKAEAIAPENPRVVLSKTEFEMGSAKFFGTDTKPLCTKAEKAIELFATFKPESAFHPNWGLDRAQSMVAACK